MNIKEIFITIIITLICGLLIGLNFFANKFVLKADSIYKVYVDGNVIGYIDNDEELYSIINNRQKEIKEKYKVDNVYPPENFQIVKTNSYNVTISPAEEIYEKLSEIESFTIEGYIISVKAEKDSFNIYVLDKDVFDKSIHEFVSAFVSNDDYNNYINNTQKEIETTGKIIEKMYFDETITIKKGYVDVNNKIFTKEKDLTQYLLFGENAKIKNYTVKAGDTIESVSDANKLNPIEFLIANPTYTSKESLLKIGDTVNITLIDPMLTLTSEITEVSDVKDNYERKIVYDTNKSPDFSEITTPGVTGITRIKSYYVVKNGEMQPGVAIDPKKEIITERVDEVVTKGRPQYSGGSYIDTGDTWGWPTNTPYVITSGFGYRWGSLHEGIDISGTGYGSPIYASLDGEVVSSQNGGMVGWQAGYNVVIKHDNGYYTVYAHMVPNSMLVKVGERVSRGQRVGSMGQSGVAYGTHLHFGLYLGEPYHGGRPLNPLTLWSNR